MSSPIKPPNAPSAGTPELLGVEAPDAKQALQPSAPPGSSGAIGAAHGDPIATLARAVDSGTLTTEAAVEQLLSQTLASARRGMTAQQLEDLSGVLRDALLSDPTLLELQRA